ncbi:ABC transporter ATP-binding protein [Agathobaculum sp.]|uniref:ABC transporter ATP-binding protein n=1 Tax=Agathobaculum sp. TaxID=2048138 RepID=UPI002A7EE295|nr:ABC transporter ATP-binding protein [Agathobaculum sp.]MDY3618646.1 ABC transporter ATP-binding protein [Agathobaculum sp.]
MLLKVESLTKDYVTRFGGRAVHALRGVDFAVGQGEYVAVMGESGSGKTTLLTLLAALERPTDGRILLDGTDMASIPGRALAAFRRDRLGFIFQDCNLLDTLSLRENILFPLVLAGKQEQEMKNRLALLTERLGISSLLDKYPYEVSGGERQRAAAARALITRPMLLLADEPTGALDSGSASQLLGLLDAYNQNDGQTIVMVTHSLDAASHASRVLFIRDGQIADEISRGELSREAFYPRLAGRLTALRQGGERLA